MFITTSGIVLRIYPFRDKKLIARIYTKDGGLVSFIIKKNKQQIVLAELLTIAEITYRDSKGRSLFYVKETQVEYVYNNLTVNTNKIGCCLLLCEILNRCLNDKNPKLYEFIIAAIVTIILNKV